MAAVMNGAMLHYVRVCGHCIGIHTCGHVLYMYTHTRSTTKRKETDGTTLNVLWFIWYLESSSSLKASRLLFECIQIGPEMCLCRNLGQPSLLVNGRAFNIRYSLGAERTFQDRVTDIRCYLCRPCQKTGSGVVVVRPCRISLCGWTIWVVRPLIPQMLFKFGKIMN